MIECDPEPRAEVVNVVVAELTTPSQRQPRVPVPRVVLPSLKVTVPVGVLAPDVVTVAVKVTESPKFEGFKLDTTAVVVEAPDAIQAAAR